MLINLGHQLYQIHDKLRLGKDRVFKPLVKLLPRRVSPNQVTLFRFIIVLILLPFALFRPAPAQIIIYFIVYFFDLLDGALARFKNQITYFGKYFDGLSDGFNHIALWIVVLGIINYQIITVKFFIAWEIFIILFIIIEYFLRNHKLAYVRTLLQFSVKIILWTILIYEIILIYR